MLVKELCRQVKIQGANDTGFLQLDWKDCLQYDSNVSEIILPLVD